MYKLHYPLQAEALVLALRLDPFYATMEASVIGDAREQHAAMVRYMDYSMREASTFGKLTLSSDVPGAAVWSLPLTPDRESIRKKLKVEFLRDELGAAPQQTYLDIVGFMSDQLGDAVDPASWYLSILALHPEFHGQGKGAGLVGPVLQQADAAGVPTYLETFVPRNMSFYERLGYRMVKSVDEPVTASRYWIMSRPCT